MDITDLAMDTIDLYHEDCVASGGGSNENIATVDRTGEIIDDWNRDLYVSSDSGYSITNYRRSPGARKYFDFQIGQFLHWLLKEGMDVNVPVFTYTWPQIAWGYPLHLVAKGGHVKIMDVLLDRGANIDARRKGVCGWTPLHIAAKERNKKAIKYLVENGAFSLDDINDNMFNPPLHYCPGLE